MTGIYAWINLAEAALWIGMGTGVLVWLLTVKAGRTQRAGLLAVLALVLIAFGISDLVETQTGAWWRPWWLLAWKILCVAAMVALLMIAALRRR